MHQLEELHLQGGDEDYSNCGTGCIQGGWWHQLSAFPSDPAHPHRISLSDKTSVGPTRLPCYFCLFSVTQRLLPAAEVETGLASKVNISHSFLINYIKYSHNLPPNIFCIC